MVITRGFSCASSGPKRRKSAGTKSMCAPISSEVALERAEEARFVTHALAAEELGADGDKRAINRQVFPVVALPEREHQRRRPSRTESAAELSTGLQQRRRVLQQSARCGINDGAPPDEGAAERDFVGVFEVGADGHAAGEPGHGEFRVACARARRR